MSTELISTRKPENDLEQDASPKYDNSNKYSALVIRCTTPALLYPSEDHLGSFEFISNSPERVIRRSNWTLKEHTKEHRKFESPHCQTSIAYSTVRKKPGLPFSQIFEG